MGKVTRFSLLAVWGAGLVLVPTLHAQEVLYIGRATSQIASNGDRSDEACAGGLTSAGECISAEKRCDESTAVCFDVTSTSGGSKTAGGAPPRDPINLPGFPQVTSTTSGSLIDLEIAQIFAGAATATADAMTGKLSGNTGGALLTVGGSPVIPIGGGSVGCNEPGTINDLTILKLTVGRTKCEVRGGRSVITVDGLVLQIPSDGPEQIFGQAIAGVELPFTEGGGRGGGGCSLSRTGDGSGGALLGGLFGLLWVVSRRRNTRR